MNKKAQTPNEKIDFVFQYIKSKADVGGNWGYKNIQLHVIASPEVGINETLLGEIISKLEDDGLIKKVKSFDDFQPAYHLTFKGLTFNGYVSEEANRQLQETRIKQLESKNHLLTKIIALGTGIAGAYYVLEILNHIFCIYPK